MVETAFVSEAETRLYRLKSRAAALESHRTIFAALGQRTMPAARCQFRVPPPCQRETGKRDTGSIMLITHLVERINTEPQRHNQDSNTVPSCGVQNVEQDQAG